MRHANSSKKKTLANTRWYRSHFRLAQARSKYSISQITRITPTKKKKKKLFRREKYSRFLLRLTWIMCRFGFIPFVEMSWINTRKIECKWIFVVSSDETKKKNPSKNHDISIWQTVFMENKWITSTSYEYMKWTLCFYIKFVYHFGLCDSIFFNELA